jgi:hypothetical protein
MKGLRLLLDDLKSVQGQALKGRVILVALEMAE